MPLELKNFLEFLVITFDVTKSFVSKIGNFVLVLESS